MARSCATWTDDTPPGLCGLQDDPFHTELATFIDVVEGRRPSGDILSSYEDAIKTYELVSEPSLVDGD